MLIARHSKELMRHTGEYWKMYNLMRIITTIVTVPRNTDLEHTEIGYIIL